jgi:5-methylcytosine-specific restriction endonuclease McrA
MQQHQCKACEIVKDETDYRVHKSGYRIGKCRECERSYQRELSRRDPEKIRARKRESMARRRAADPDKARAYSNAYHAANRAARTKNMRDYYARRFFWGRAMKLRGVGRATAADLASIWKAQRGSCALTGRKLDQDAQLDHVVARARGGTDERTNLRWLCREANLARRELSDDEFIALCSDVLKHKHTLRIITS